MRSRGLITAILAAVAIAGCGGGGGGSGGQAKPPTKQQYIARVDMICGALKSDLRGLQAQLQQSGGMGGSRSQQFMRAANALDRTIQVATRRINEIKSTPRPPGQAGQGATRYVQSLDQQLALLRQLRDAAEKKDVNAFKTTAMKIAELGPKSDGIAQGYGLKTCSSSSQ